jgi:hypothetical protein
VQQIMSPGQTPLSSAQPCTWQVREANVSQNVASVPAQSAGFVQAIPKPFGAATQACEPYRSQSSPAAHSALLEQPPEATGSEGSSVIATHSDEPAPAW